MLLRALFLGLFTTLAAAQSSVLSFTRVPNPITDGETAVLLWQTNDTTSPVELSLKQGPTSNLKMVEVITKTATGGQYLWKPATSIADGQDYVLVITQGTQNNTFGPFTIQGANPSAVASASSSARNATMTHASTGTGTAMHRNTTMSHATLAHSKTMSNSTSKTTKTTVTSTAKKTTTTAAPVSTSSAAAMSQFSTSSSFALVVGAVAAIFYLQ